jgi:hypothetical protein
MRKRVFLSSVMQGFEAERSAATDAIETLRHEVVRAEDFGAKPHSSQLACLEGVRSSDIYVGVFGERYGYPVQSGLSPTEEEFREAVKRGMPVLCFIWKGEKEPRQEEFLKGIKDFEDGYFVEFYSNPDALGKGIIRALNDLSASEGRTLDAIGAANIFVSRFDICSPAERGSPALRMGVIPERQAEEYFPPRVLGSDELRDRIGKVLLFGPKPRFFNTAHGVLEQEGEDYLRLHQEAERHSEPTRSLSVFHDAAILGGTVVQRETNRSVAFMTAYIIDEEVLAENLHSFLAVAEEIISAIPQGQLLSSFFVWLQLTGIEDKYFGKVPSPAPNSMSMPGHRLSDPLGVPKEPLHVSRQQIKNPGELVVELVERAARTFRAAGAYYTGEARGW